jgi:FkbM family methyltransferase
MSARMSTLRLGVKRVVEIVVLKRPWFELIVGSEFLSRRYGKRLLRVLNRRPPSELRFRGNLRISDFLLRHHGRKLNEVMGRNPPPELMLRRHGAEMSVPWEFGIDYCFKEFEELTVRWLADHLHPGGVALDVGAHIGYFTVLMAKYAPRSGRVYAVEPDEFNLRFLRKNVARNRADSVTILPVAAGARSRVRPFHLMTNSSVHGFYKHPLGILKEIVQVAEVPLDELVEAPVDVVKIDVEGAELEVLEGMTAILRSSPTVSLIVEWNPTCLGAAGYAPDALPAYLRANGFTLFLIDNLSGAIRSIEEVLELFKAGTLHPHWYGNLIGRREHAIDASS